ncbi:MAG: hypothetical protein E7212_15075 [Clostridium sartagoforme]|nr:hypothetical protein [Clostridium sartagoforme]
MSKKEQVYNVLIMPIECTRHSSGSSEIKKEDNIIKSTQTYNRALDPDMSDISIEFYKIIYSDIGNILSDCGGLKDCNFAGDTMNSFHLIANITPGAGKSKKQRAEMDWQKITRFTEIL